MSMLKPLAAVVLWLAFTAASAAAADSPQLGKPISEADIKPWDITVLPGRHQSAGWQRYRHERAKLRRQGLQPLPRRERQRRSNDLGRQSLAHRGWHRLDQDHRQFLGVAHDIVRLRPPRHAVDSPHTLSNDEVYALCAYLFAANNLIPQDEVMNAQTLPR